MSAWKIKSCSKCGGDLFSQDGEWGCIQCGQYYYPAHTDPLETTPLPTVEPFHAVDASGRSMRCGGIAGRNINASVCPQPHSQAEQWRSKNRQIIACLGRGRSVAQIATLLGKNLREVRNVAAMLRGMNVGTSA